MWEDWLDKIKENKVMTGLVLLVLLLAAGLAFNLYHQKQKPTSDFPELTQTSTHQQSSNKFSTSTTSETIMVDVKGAVKTEGVYQLPAGSRVTDAVKKAGGFTDKANKKSVNLAQKLEDEDVVYVAIQGEEVNEVTQANQAPNHQTGSATSDSKDKINLNKATVEELQTISGIGEKRAQDIIDYREEHGGFTSVEELKEISGIGDKTYEKIAAEVTI
ncbi:helix-hairpin-helix domain-containing protein [Streptococcus dentapri]|uniref:Helix-hairpin-helix domain-containing protein n=1 Tax=Streptococcus dentapri TaxID=573564 RepID=A0ABV8D2R5_9STRE